MIIFTISAILPVLSNRMKSQVSGNRVYCILFRYKFSAFCPKVYLVSAYYQMTVYLITRLIILFKITLIHWPSFFRKGNVSYFVPTVSVIAVPDCPPLMTQIFHFLCNGGLSSLCDSVSKIWDLDCFYSAQLHFASLSVH